MPPSTFSEAWGGVMICILVSATLNGCIIMQACSYFLKFQTDPLVLRSAVAVIWLSSILHFSCECWLIHSITILGYDRPFYAVMIPFVFSIAVALEAIVHCTVQGAYIFRMYRFGQNPYVLGLCCMLVLVELGMGLAWTGRVAIPSTTVLQVDARDQQTRWIITSFFTISAFVDVFITASVSYQLRRRRTNSLKRTKYLIDKVIQWTIPTGMLTSVVAIVIVLVWNIQRDSFLWVGICAFESDCYAAGLLALLNARRTRFNTTEPDHLSISMSRYPETLTSSDVARITATAVSGPSTSSLDHPKGQDGSQDVVVYKLQNDSW